ncbi:hypothetical protein ACFSMW_06760 [Virgibacillus halophilus]|uniref:Uncharacterized protein n=1 Tax=Tigheibacillus halophilus TaxID=361280 RepID=A0ABU5C607_9BACI|nr:hypothetical protein [Virgibacillus halophilus]
MKQSWGYKFIPCPDPKCDFNKKQAQQKVFSDLDRLMEKKVSA